LGAEFFGGELLGGGESIGEDHQCRWLVPIFREERYTWDYA
jgi:hypothetical protein